ncbi:MAG TPA: hypothetical protein VK867_01575, partial [Candidatus Limnocylindrales bacterium]|nr:hypothetical protein [Candidatus Limnocylindrales bacterium]
MRQRPGSDGLVLTGLLPLDATLQVVMGPIAVDDLGWYLVTDADDDEPQFEEGWIAAGFEPEAWIGGVAEAPDESPFVASFTGTGDAEHGPIRVADRDHAIRWIAGDPDEDGCRFAVSLAPAGGADPIAAIR